MNNISYLRNDSNFKQKLPELIEKYNLKQVPNSLVGRTLINEGVMLIIDNKDVRVNIFKKNLEFSLN